MPANASLCRVERRTASSQEAGAPVSPPARGHRWRSQVDRARAGDRAAFEALYREFAPVVHGVLLARVQRSDADDLVQDVFLAAWSRLESLRDGDAFGGWVCAIARHKAATYRRGPVRPAGLPDALAASPTAAGQMDEAERVMVVIRSLPEAYRETLVLRLVAGMTGPEIAARTGMTPGSVRVNLCRGMEMLRERLGARDREDEL